MQFHGGVNVWSRVFPINLVLIIFNKPIDSMRLGELVWRCWEGATAGTERDTHRVGKPGSGSGETRRSPHFPTKRNIRRTEGVSMAESRMKAVKDFMSEGQSRPVTLPEFKEFWVSLSADEKAELSAAVPE